MRERVLEIQVDFFFLGTHKFVLFRQVMTGLLGVTAVSEDTRVTEPHQADLSRIFPRWW